MQFVGIIQNQLGISLAERRQCAIAFIYILAERPGHQSLLARASPIAPEKDMTRSNNFFGLCLLKAKSQQNCSA